LNPYRSWDQRFSPPLPLTPDLVVFSAEKISARSGEQPYICSMWSQNLVAPIFLFCYVFLPNMSLSKDGPSPACSSSDEDFDMDAIIAAIDLEAIGSQFSISSVALQL
jgi:hypothetical protein